MIFHSATKEKEKKNKKKRKRKRKREKKKKKKRKRKKKGKRKRKDKKRKEGIKELKRKAPCNNSYLAIPFKNGQVLFKFNVAGFIFDTLFPILKILMFIF